MSEQINETTAPRPGRGAAIASLVCGIVAMTLPVPFLDIVAGIIGLVMFSKAKKQGFKGGLLTAGLVCSIIGTVWATIFTIMCIPVICAMATYGPETMNMLQSF